MQKNNATSQTVSTQASFTCQPHEMPANMLKDHLLAELKNPAIASDSQKFFLEHHPVTKELLIPCLLMATKQHDVARQLLTGQVSVTPQMMQGLRDHEETSATMKSLELLEGQSFKNVVDEIVAMVERLDVTPLNKHQYKSKGYVTYYADKHEDFSLESQQDWQAKQKNVYTVLQDIKPQTVLDVGSNSGWYSRLAAHLGAHVIATDIDEACLDFQYYHAKKNQLNLVPLVQSFEKLADDKVAARVQSDVTMCLALIHHLVFLGGMTLDEIFSILAKVTKKVLILEFVALEDETIQHAIKHPTFFKNINIHQKAIHILETYGYKHYNEKNIIKEGSKFFKSVQILNSSPKTRQLLIFTKEEKELA